jgi:Tfp pilus assembly protein PilF
MKNLYLIFAGLLWVSDLSAQNKIPIDSLLNQGVQLHDAGKYEEAIALYDQILKQDPDHLLALSEKALSAISIGQYEQAMTCSQKAIEKHPGSKNLRSAYVTYGNACDASGMPEKALEVYAEGLKKFPDHFQLYFNQGVTQAGQKQYEAAITSFQQAVRIKPTHASSHNGIARLEYGLGHKIPALLAFMRFLCLEQLSKRAGENIATLDKILIANVAKRDDNNIQITLDAESLKDTLIRENNFKILEVSLALSAAADFTDEYQKETRIERLNRKIELFCSTLHTAQKDQKGFYWTYYAPYFIEMQEQKQVSTFVYIALAGTKDKAVDAWLQSHKDEINAFFDWSEAYAWK